MPPDPLAAMGIYWFASRVAVEVGDVISTSGCGYTVDVLVEVVVDVDGTIEVLVEVVTIEVVVVTVVTGCTMNLTNAELLTFPNVALTITLPTA